MLLVNDILPHPPPRNMSPTEKDFLKPALWYTHTLNTDKPCSRLSRTTSTPLPLHQMIKMEGKLRNRAAFLVKKVCFLSKGHYQVLPWVSSEGIRRRTTSINLKCNVKIRTKRWSLFNLNLMSSLVLCCFNFWSKWGGGWGYSLRIKLFKCGIWKCVCVHACVWRLLNSIGSLQSGWYKSRSPLRSTSRPQHFTAPS